MTTPVSTESPSSRPYWNPYLAGILLGLVLLASFVLLGTGLGASAGIARLGAWCELVCYPDRYHASAYFSGWGDQPLRYYLVFMLAGTLFGGLASALFAGRVQVVMERGRTCSRSLRFYLALFGGLLAGYASRLAQGCTSGQALTGSALLMTGSLAFLVSVFAGGYLGALFVGRQWHD